MIIREINSLKKTLDDNNINTTQSLTFIKNQEMQILYVSEPKSRDIWRYVLQNTQCHKCKDNNDLTEMFGGGTMDTTPGGTINVISKPLKQAIPSESNDLMIMNNQEMDDTPGYLQNQEQDTN